MHYLRHLALAGAAHIHPGGGRASRLLLHSLALRAGDTVLELGCGTGATLLRAASEAPGSIVGLDAMPEMLAAAARRVAALEPAQRPALVAANIMQLPFADASFDRAYAESVLGMQDAHCIIATLRELHRVLRSGAVCVINDAIWNPQATDAEIAATNRHCEESFGLRQASLEPWRLDDWRRAIHSAGFRLESYGLLAEQLRPGAAGRALRAVRRSLRNVLHLCQSLAAVLPGADAGRLRYARALWQHRAQGQLIEARLFVLVRV